jgi:hypothetical protein
MKNYVRGSNKIVRGPRKILKGFEKQCSCLAPEPGSAAAANGILDTNSLLMSSSEVKEAFHIRLRMGNVA